MSRFRPLRAFRFAAGFPGMWPAVVVLLVTGCVSRPEPPPVPAGAPGEFTAAGRVYRDAAARGEPVYRLDDHGSMVRILVFRTGALARLGHNHAVTGRQIRGYAWLPVNGPARADLYLALATLIVDEPQAREAAGFTTGLTQEDRNGTYRNMLASLEAGHYPHVLLHVTLPMIGPMTPPIADRDTRTADVDLTLHGMTRRLTVPVQIVTAADGFRVTGTFRIRQTDYGIEPFSVFGGALAVRDELELNFDLGFIGY